MKKSYVMIRFFFVLVMIAAFLACASTPQQSSTGEVVDDSVITTKIKSLLAEMNFSSHFRSASRPAKASLR